MGKLFGNGGGVQKQVEVANFESRKKWKTTKKNIPLFEKKKKQFLVKSGISLVLLNLNKDLWGSRIQCWWTERPCNNFFFFFWNWIPLFANIILFLLNTESLGGSFQHLAMELRFQTSRLGMAIVLVFLEIELAMAWMVSSIHWQWMVDCFRFSNRSIFFQTNSSFKMVGKIIGTSMLYVGGSFNTAGCTSAFGIALWNGTSWSFLGTNSSINGVSGTVGVLAMNGTSEL